MMTSSATTDRGSSSTDDLEEKTVSIAPPSGTAALSAGDTTAAARSVSSKLTAREELGMTGAVDDAPVTVLPPEPVYFIHAINGLDVRKLNSTKVYYTEIPIG